MTVCCTVCDPCVRTASPALRSFCPVTLEISLNSAALSSPQSVRQTARGREVAWSPHRDTSAARRRSLTPSFPSGPTSRGSCCRQRNNSGGIITFSSVDHTHYHSPHPPTPASRGLLAAVFHTFRRPPPLSLNRARLKRQKAPDHTRKHTSSHVRPSSASRDAPGGKRLETERKKALYHPLLQPTNPRTPA